MQKRLPKLNQIVPVYAVIVFLAYGWMLSAVIWKLPSWLFLMSPPEILASLAYSFNEIFWESLLMLAPLVLAAAILPSGWLRDDFVPRASWFSFVVVASIIAYFYVSLRMDLRFVIWAVGTFALALGAAVASTRWVRLSQLALKISDTLIIFLYIYLPLSILSVLILIIRNLA